MNLKIVYILIGCMFYAECTEHSSSTSVTVLKTDVIFLLDSSLSITSAQFEIEKQIIVETIQEFKKRNYEFNIGVIRFSSKSAIQFVIDIENSSKESLITDIKHIPKVGYMTYIGHALEMACTIEMPTGNRKVVVVISSGTPSDSVTTDNALALCKQKNALMISVGKNYVGKFIRGSNFGFPIELTAENVGETAIGLYSSISNIGSCTRASFSDIILQIDASKFVGESAWKSELQLAARFTEILNIASPEVRLGVTEVDDVWKRVAGLNEYNGTTLVAIIKNLKKGTGSGSHLQTTVMNSFREVVMDQYRKKYVIFLQSKEGTNKRDIAEASKLVSRYRSIISTLTINLEDFTFIKELSTCNLSKVVSSRDTLDTLDLATLVNAVCYNAGF